MKNLKILQIVYSGFGGSGSVAFSIFSGAKKFKSSKISCFLLFFGKSSLCKDYRVKCHNEKISYLYIKKKFFNLFYFFRIYSFLKKNKPDVIVNHENILLPCLIYWIFNKLSFLYVLHSPFSFNIKRIVKFLIPLVTIKNIILVSKRKDFLFLLSKYIKKIQIIENGIDRDIFKKIEKKKKSLFTIGMACRFVDQKRPDLLLETVKKYKKIFLKNRIKLSLAGNGPNTFKLKNYVKNNSLIDIVNFEGYLNEDQMVKWFNKINIFINISNFETTPTTILQAFAIPLPVIASNIKGHREIAKNKFRNTSNLLLVKNNTDEIYQKIMYLYLSKKILNNYKASAEFASKKIYNDKSMFKKYFYIIKKKINENT
jgi:hypothetical protein